MSPKKRATGHLTCQFVIALLATLIAAGCRSEDRLPEVGKSVAEEVTLDQLFSAPQKFDGALVRVIGLCTIAFESNSLHRREDGSDRIGVSPAETQRGKVMSEHSVQLALGWPVSPDVRALNGKYALVEGRFDPASNGDVVMNLGTLRDIRRIEESSPDADAAMRRRVSAGR